MNSLVKKAYENCVTKTLFKISLGVKFWAIGVIKKLLTSYYLLMK